MRNLTLWVSLAVAAIFALAAAIFFLLFGAPEIGRPVGGAPVAVAAAGLSRTDFLCVTPDAARVAATGDCRRDPQACAARLTRVLRQSGDLEASKTIEKLAPHLQGLRTPDVNDPNWIKRPVWKITASPPRAAGRGGMTSDPVSYLYSPCSGRVVPLEM